MPIVTVQQFLEAKLDYLVVGGGTAGLVVAARLTEDSNVTVGVLEAGKYHEDVPEVNIPGFVSLGLHNPALDWDFRSVPQKYVDNREMSQSRGKGLGGSSLLNFLLMPRPGKSELDAWEKLGNTGWDWQTTVEYMKKSEHIEVPAFTPEDAIRYAAVPGPETHGSKGPIAKSFPSQISGTYHVLLDTLESLGVHRNPDNGNGNPVGTRLAATSVDSKTATRSHSAAGYYTPNARRQNLLVLTGAYVTSINLAAASGGLQRAVGASFIFDGQTFDVKAGHEVILSASTFQNPQLLELSGIGDKDILSSFAIDTKIDLPGVGENLQDHAIVTVVSEVDQTVDSQDVLFDPAKLAEQQKLYGQQRGVLAEAVPTIFAFLPSTSIGDSEDVQRWKKRSSVGGAAPEVFKRTKPSVKVGIEKQYEILRDRLDDQTQPFSQLLIFNGSYPVPGYDFDHSKGHLSIFCAYPQPFHRGTVHIQSTDPTAPPIIQPNYFSNDNDHEILVRSVQFVEKLYETEPFKQMVRKRIVPKGDETEEELREWTKDALTTLHHPVGTCAMLPRESGGVVDSRLLVYGTKNLRIVDTSIIPLQVSCNVQTMAYAIGEKGADIIKGII